MPSLLDASGGTCGPESRTQGHPRLSGLSAAHLTGHQCLGRGRGLHAIKPLPTPAGWPPSSLSHPPAASNTSWVARLLPVPFTWREHQTPRVRGSVPQMPVASTGCHLSFCPRGPQSRGSVPLLGFEWLARWLSELRHTLLTRSPVYYEGRNLGTAGLSCTGRVWGGARGPPPALRSPSPGISPSLPCSPAGKALGPALGHHEAPPHRCDPFWLQYLRPPRSLAGGAQFPRQPDPTLYLPVGTCSPHSGDSPASRLCPQKWLRPSVCFSF